MKVLSKILLVMLCAMLLPLSAVAEENARVMPEPYASATFTDPSEIPYPAERDENGYLLPGTVATSMRLIDEATGDMESYETEGEFVYENPAQGLWAYLSPTLQVQIIQYDGSWADGEGKKPLAQRWFLADVKFDVTAESFERHRWYQEDVTGMDVLGKLQKNGVTRGDFADQAIWPKTLAQCDRMVFAVNGDFYLGRVSSKQPTGNILRSGEVLYDVKPGSKLSFPDLDSAAFFPDGSMKVFDTEETTATEQQALGARDMVSFGPWLVRDGVLRDYTGNFYDHRDPRMAIGMVEPGHYVIIDSEGHIPKDGPQGLTLNELGALLYYNGANEAINMDGGNTSVMIFMGEKLNRTGKVTVITTPRNQNELFGVGKSEQVRTDWANGDPKKK